MSIGDSFHLREVRRRAALQTVLDKIEQSLKAGDRNKAFDALNSEVLRVEECGRRSENEAWCRSVCNMCETDPNPYQGTSDNDDYDYWVHLNAGRTCHASHIRARMEENKNV